jgi:spermidine/putrescine transport system permease protein
MTDLAERHAVAARHAPGKRLLRRVERAILPIFTLLAIAYLLVPIVVMVVFSFNEAPGRFNFQWGRFSLDGWRNPLAWPGLQEALTTSLTVATLATVGSTILGTLIGLALVRHRFRGRGPINALIFLPIATPEIILGASLLTLFVSTALPPLNDVVPGGLFFPTGFLTILIAHIMFNISYVVVTIRARLTGFPRHLEEAAMDLGANEWTTFWRVTFPLIFPGIMAAAVLAFALSVDDFVITVFVAGTTNTFPVWTWGILRNALPVQIYVVGTIIFTVAVGFVVLTTVLQARRGRLAAALPDATQEES